MTELQQDYYDWLYDGVTESMSNNYSQLIAALWDKEFYSILANDDNRGEDGLNLRYFYITEEANLPDAALDELIDLGPCRCLEMIIALARRMEGELYGSVYDKYWDDLFWELIENLGMIDFHNGRFYNSDSVHVVDNILARWLERGYGRDGVGGLFPISRPIHSQAKLEVWYQMMDYLLINYPI